MFNMIFVFIYFYTSIYLFEYNTSSINISQHVEK